MNNIDEFLLKTNAQKVLVIAGNQKEFNVFIDMALDLFEKEGRYNGWEFIYYLNVDTVRGNRFDNYFYYGTGIDRIGKDINEIDIFYIDSSIKF